MTAVMKRWFVIAMVFVVTGCNPYEGIGGSWPSRAGPAPAGSGPGDFEIPNPRDSPDSPLVSGVYSCSWEASSGECSSGSEFFEAITVDEASYTYEVSQRDSSERGNGRLDVVGVVRGINLDGDAFEHRDRLEGYVDPNGQFRLLYEFAVEKRANATGFVLHSYTWQGEFTDQGWSGLIQYSRNDGGVLCEIAIPFSGERVD